MFVNIIVLLLIFFGGFLTIVITVKLRERHKALKWPSVAGEIISGQISAAMVTTHTPMEDGEPEQVEIRNFVRVAYRYTVNGKRYTGKRVSIGEDMGNDDVEARIRRYPKGKMVEVFYDPANPSLAVLERDLPEGCAKAGLIALGLVILIVTIGVGLDYASDLVAANVSSSDNAFMIIFSIVFSVIAFLIAATFWENAHAARKWPRTKGHMADAADAGIVYHYHVNKISYQSDMITLVRGGRRTNAFRLPSGITLRAGVPAEFDVFYNPSDPSKCCLDPRTPAIIVLPLLIAVFMAGTAWMIWSQ